MVGTSAPDFEFADGARLGAHLSDGKPLLLDFADSAALRGVAGERVRVLTAKLTGQYAGELTGVLVRPDGHIAWATADNTTTGLDASLKTWIG
ncbi:hypothetical protein JOF29_007796 [Kribbella aluminosa]|uniref:Uncharacterized protein n=1 Tax=Kribbella aluminosa TaxID=416017 RepID=A0ABS4UYF4_9ACTN|nr:hypothetical protein [Kribbella aluminosa]MBP2356686.1 hypothetical protein [Kribbella aluminosa]